MVSSHPPFVWIKSVKPKNENGKIQLILHCCICFIATNGRVGYEDVMLLKSSFKTIHFKVHFRSVEKCIWWVSLKKLTSIVFQESTQVEKIRFVCRFCFFESEINFGIWQERWRSTAYLFLLGLEEKKLNLGIFKYFHFTKPDHLCSWEQSRSRLFLDCLDVVLKLLRHYF